ncbi:TPA: phosphate starvation-inducible protein PsiE, partial [Shigella flexneri]
IQFFTVYNGCLCWTGIPVQPKTPEEGITRWQGKSVVFDASYNVFDDKVLRKNFNEFME